MRKTLLLLSFSAVLLSATSCSVFRGRGCDTCPRFNKIDQPGEEVLAVKQ